MKSLLNALKDGRLVELPPGDKDSSLRYLAHLIEAVPEMAPGIDFVEEIFKRERAGNSGLGLGVACPHVRVPGNGELLSSVGWSPSGVDYGAPDGKKVHLVVMYFIPDAQKHAYLKEISGLAEAVKKKGSIQSIATAENISSVREQLLDWVSTALEAAGSQAKAKMIRLEARSAAQVTAEPPSAPAPAPVKEVPAAVVRDPKKLLNRVSRLKGQLEAVEKALNDGEDYSMILHILAACRGAMDGLMLEVIEGQVLQLADPTRRPSDRSKATQDLIDVLKSYLR